MPGQNIQQSVAELLGTSVFPIPLESCRIIRPYLLERAGIASPATALFFAIPYLVAADVHAPERNLSLYAVPRDYHMYVRQLSDEIIPVLREKYPAYPFAVFSDHSPIAESDAAARAGLGVLGKNHMLITREYGSFVFIAEVIVGADYLTVTGQRSDNIPDNPPSCPGCGACLRACPAADASGQACSGCLSSLTQKRGMLTASEQAALQRHALIWGCDECQLACPLNRVALSGTHDTPIDFFLEDRMLFLTAEGLDGMSENDFKKRAFAWRGRDVLKRNLQLHESMAQDACKKAEDIEC